jgi:hypothetical protein
MTISSVIVVLINFKQIPTIETFFILLLNCVLNLKRSRSMVKELSAPKPDIALHQKSWVDIKDLKLEKHLIVTT